MKIFFDAKKLGKEVQALLKEKSNVYAWASALETLLESTPSTNIHELLCLANLEMACAQATDFEEDIVHFGEKALYWLKQAWAIEPENSEIQKDMLTIEKKIKKAKKTAGEILKYEKDNLDEMPNLDYVKELAFYYYSRNAKGKEYAEKGYKCYLYVYEKVRAEKPDSSALLYYWNALTECKWLAHGYAATQAEIEQLTHWALQPQFMIYRNYITDGYWMKLLHYCEVDDYNAFRDTYSEWYDKMIPLEKEGIIQITDLPILNAIGQWLLSKTDANRYLSYILEHGYRVFNKKVLSEKEIAIMDLIQHTLELV